MTSTPHVLSIDVRDYECDMQGIVNNAVYQNYLEHARHQFLKQQGLDFAEVTAMGIHLVVMRAEIDYKFPLKSGMTLIVETYCSRLSKFKFEFTQSIKIPSLSDKLSLEARFVIASINEAGRPVIFEDADKLVN